MKEILSELQRWDGEGEEIALATLVRVRGSAPRRPGARLALTRSGRMLGSVSGGCVENDVIETARRVLETGRPELASYGISDDQGFEVGLSCGGRIDVLVERFRADGPWRALCSALEKRSPAALCVGLAPGALRGRRLVILDGEAVAGGIDGKLDGAIAATAGELSGEAAARVVELSQRDGPASIFLQAFAPAPRLFIVGATHAAVPLCRMAAELGFWVAVVDPRGAFVRPERFPEADQVIPEWPGPALKEAGLEAGSFVVTLTHDPKVDLPALAEALASPAGYIGAMGSRRTQRLRLERLREKGFGDDALARIRGPVGLDLGSRSPEETALAILAEMVAVRNRRDARPLFAGRGRIHAG
jgi:xanthine dehydrogenase accessory factor